MESVAQRAIALIQKQGSMRSDQIAEALGVSGAVIASSVAGHCRNGTLVSCKVERTNGGAVNEYRMSASGKAKNWHAEPAERKPPTPFPPPRCRGERSKGRRSGQAQGPEVLQAAPGICAQAAQIQSRQQAAAESAAENCNFARAGQSSLGAHLGRRVRSHGHRHRDPAPGGALAGRVHPRARSRRDRPGEGLT